MPRCYNHAMQRVPHVAEIDDRRDAPRVGMDGRFSLRLDPCDGRDPIACVLLDHSVTGMRMELLDSTTLPERVQILIGGMSHNGRIAWCKGNVIGIDFIDEHHSIF